jgi:GNAT superfamily N-acetyltransferase
MSIRLMEPKDLPAVIALGSQMHQESVYSKFDFDENKLGRLLYNHIINPKTLFAYVGSSKGALTGVFLGSIGEHYFGTDLIASDTLWYVSPQSRGSRVGLQLLRAFENWAKERDAAEIYVGVSSGLSADKTGTMLQKLGYDVVGGNYKLHVVL